MTPEPQQLPNLEASRRALQAIKNYRWANVCTSRKYGRPCSVPPCSVCPLRNLPTNGGAP